MSAAKKKPKKSAARGGMSTREPPAVPKMHHPETIALAKRLHAWLKEPDEPGRLDAHQLEPLLTVLPDLVRSKEDAIRVMTAAVVELAGDPITQEHVPTALAALDAMHRGKFAAAGVHAQRIVSEIDMHDSQAESAAQFVLVVLGEWLETKGAK